MFKPAIAIALMACSMPAFAANDYPSARMQTALPSEAMTVTDWYKQNVYDPNENKIGDIKDVLVDKSGKVVALIVGVGGFLGAGEKDVAVPFEAVHPTMKDKKWWLVMNTTKDSSKAPLGLNTTRTRQRGYRIGRNQLPEEGPRGKRGALSCCFLVSLTFGADGKGSHRRTGPSVSRRRSWMSFAELLHVNTFPAVTVVNAESNRDNR